jgi:hypothetical protein
MPNGVYPVPKFRPRAGRAPRAWQTRLHVWWHRAELDERLAAGVQPEAGTALHVRAEQLGSPAGRVRLARALHDVVREAHAAPATTGARVPLRYREIRACEDDIRALARRLADARPIDVQGAAMTTLLLDDPSGPLSRAGALSLRFSVRSARLALDHVDEVLPALPHAA